MSDVTLYEILGVSPTSESVVIEGAYRALMRRYQNEAHTSAEAAAKVQRINAAYSTLSNARKRALYDASLTNRAKPASTAPPPDTVVKPPAKKVAPPAPLAAPKKPITSTQSNQHVAGQEDKSRLGIFIVGILVFFAVIKSCGDNPDSLSELNDATMNESSTEVEQANEAQANVVAETKPPDLPLDEIITFADPANCVAGPTLSRAFENLLPISNTTGEPLTPIEVALGDVQLTPKLDDYVGAGDPPGTIAKISSVRLPREAVWHGLRASRLIASYYSPPETDSSYSRSITFRATPDEVRSVLAAQGFDPPSSGSYSSLTDEGCGGSMEIVPVAGGSELRCSWGC